MNIQTLHYMVYYFNKSKLHREDGPAVETLDGYKAWYMNAIFIVDSS
jgi:hypothetical protein